MKRFVRNHSAAMTLVELLVVVALLAVLACLVISISSGAVSRGRTLMCAAKLHNIGNAWAARKSDRGRAPLMAVNWPSELYKYLDTADEVYQCPEGSGTYSGSSVTGSYTTPGSNGAVKHSLEITTLGGGGRLSLDKNDSFWVWDMSDETMGAFWLWNGRAHSYQQNLDWYRSEGRDKLPGNPKVYWKPIEDMAATDRQVGGADGDFMDLYIRYEQLSDGKLSITFLWAGDPILSTTKPPPGWPYNYVPGFTVYRHSLLDNGVVQRSNVGVYTPAYVIEGNVAGHTEYYTTPFDLPALSYGVNVAAVKMDDPRTIVALDYKTALANDGESFSTAKDDEGIAARHTEGKLSKGNVLSADGSVRLQAPGEIDPAVCPARWGP